MADMPVAESPVDRFLGFTVRELIELRRAIDARALDLPQFLQYVRDLETDAEGSAVDG